MHGDVMKMMMVVVIIYINECCDLFIMMVVI